MWPLFVLDFDNFNPRSHEGYDYVEQNAKEIDWIFQSTYPRRVRLVSVYNIMERTRDFNPRTHEGYDEQCDGVGDLIADFNPRTHEGYDQDPVYFRDWTDKFQSTYPRRVRPFVVSIPSKFLLFQSTYPRRVRRNVAFGSMSDYVISIHVPTKGTTRLLALRQLLVIISIHVPTKGTTECNQAKWQRCRNFNPRTHEGYDKHIISSF